MIGVLIILLVTIAVGFLLYVYDLRWRRKNAIKPDPSDQSDRSDHGEICCGRHLVCEKSLSPLPGEEIVYYDDEELDRLADRDPATFSAEEIEELRDVLLTLLPEDGPGWARSLQLRRISLPPDLKDELFILLDDLKSQPSK